MRYCTPLATGQVRLDYINDFFSFVLMKTIQQHPIKGWEVSIMKIQDGNKISFKVTRRLPELSVAETKIFNSLEKAKEQFGLWLQ